MRDHFLNGASVVLNAVSDERVGAAWGGPSILADQPVGSLVGHLARGSVWVVDDYLDAGKPEDPISCETAADYFVTVAGYATEETHSAIRDRSATVAAEGQQQVVATLSNRLSKLEARLPTEPVDRRVKVAGGLVMRLDDYLWTRIVEQVVHLDDLARSLGIEPWENPPDAEALVISCGAEIGRQRRGGPAMIRALFRDGTDSLPVF